MPRRCCSCAGGTRVCRSLRCSYPCRPWIAWVALNYLGIERTTTSARVDSVADVHLAYMPYSHSVATAVAAAMLVWWIAARVTRRRDAATALAIGVLSHLVLDLLTHARDIAVAPRMPIMLGAGLYGRSPMAAFFVELGFGICCWWVYIAGRRARTAWRGLLAFVAIGVSGRCGKCESTSSPPCRY